MKIFVGSTNIVKIQATGHAFTKFFPQQQHEVEAVVVDSHVSHQPFGLDEIITGAKNRAFQSRDKISEFTRNAHESLKNFSYYVGIEAGFVDIPFNTSNYIDFQFCVILRSDGKLSVGCGSGFSFPPSVISHLLNDREKELGDIMAKLSGNQRIKHEDGAVGFYTQGKITRTEITQQAVEMALIPFMNSDAYFPEDLSKED